MKIFPLFDKSVIQWKDFDKNVNYYLCMSEHSCESEMLSLKRLRRIDVSIFCVKLVINFTKNIET